MDLFQEKVSADAGVWTVFETRKGIEKMLVAPTGKSKLHVFPLRRAKENRGFALLKPMTPLKRCQSQTFSSVFSTTREFRRFSKPEKGLRKCRSLRPASRNSMFFLCAEQRKMRLCPFNPHKPFFEGLDPKIYGSVSGKSER